MTLPASATRVPRMMVLACDHTGPEVEREMTTSDGGGKTMRVGVLIIGSLYWDDKKTRKDWRRERLVDLGEKKHVRAPIRYGRLSRSRGCSYTMVLSKQLDSPSMRDKCGCAIVVPCKTPVNGVEDLITEAQHPWHAEGGKADSISAAWGCVALLEDPERPMPDDRRDGWTKHFVQGEHHGALNTAPPHRGSRRKKGASGGERRRAPAGSSRSSPDKDDGPAPFTCGAARPSA